MTLGSSVALYWLNLKAICLPLRLSVSGTMQPLKAGADILLDLLSIGSPAPVQNGSMNGDLISIQDNNAPIASIDTISSTSPTAPSSMMDLLDGFGPNPPKSGKDGMFNITFAPFPLFFHVLKCDDGISFSSMTEDKGPAYPSIVAFESSSLKIEFNFTKQPENPQTTDIVANFTNLTPNVYTDFLFQAAVPKVRSQTCFFCLCYKPCVS